MRLRISQVAFLVLVGCAALRAQAGADSAAPPAPASVSGVATNTVTGEPVLRAHIVLRGIMNEDGGVTYGALTDRDGKFTISNLPPGRYTATASRTAFVPPPNINLTLSAGEKKDDVKLKLTPTGAIVGRVLDSAGEPVPHAGVHVEGSHSNENVSTDEQGRFRIGGLQPGKYRVRAARGPTAFPEEIRTDGTVETHYSPTYYPGSLTRSGARRVEVLPGADLNGIDIQLIATALVSVSGKVSGIPTGKGHPAIQLNRDGETGFGGEMTAVKADGTFKIAAIDPGKYTLTAILYGTNAKNRFQSPPVEIEVAGTNLQNVDLRLIPAFDVQGQVRFDSEKARMPQAPGKPGQPAASAASAPTRYIMLEGGQSRGVIGEDDSFTMENVVAGRHRVTLSWGAGYVRSVRVGDNETEGDMLDVRNGPSGPVTVTVGSDFCEVSGTVNDSKGPAPNTLVYLVSEAGRHVQGVVTKADGTYRMPGVPPGKYRLAAVEEGFTLDGMAGSQLEDYADVAESLDLRPGDKITKDLKKK
jgi:Carboxypeptidase regulatory-like domain